jgi:hypothetical protein
MKSKITHFVGARIVMKCDKYEVVIVTFVVFEKILRTKSVVSNAHMIVYVLGVL